MGRRLERVLAVALLSAAPLYARDVTAVAGVDSARFFVGDPIALSIRLTHPGGLQFTPLVGDTLGSFTVLQPPSMARDGSGSIVNLVLSRYDSGSVLIPSVTLAYSLPGDTALHTVATQPLPVHIALVEVDTTQPIRDLRPPLEVPLSIAELAVIAGIILGVAAMAFFLYRYWKRRRRGITAIPVVAEVRPAHALALEELGLLKGKRLWQQGLVKEYYSEVTEIIRRYFENRFHIAALEQTTDEILDALTPHAETSGLPEKTGKFLSRADLVKFAKYAPGVAEHEETLTMAYEIIETTRPDLPMAGVAPAPEEMKHAGS